MKKMMFVACVMIACGCQQQQPSNGKCGEKKCEQPKKCCEAEKKAEPVAAVAVPAAPVAQAEVVK